MNPVKSKKAAPASKSNRTEAILKRIDAVQKQIDRQMADLDVSLKASEPVYLKMKAVLHAAEKVGKRVKA